MIHILIQSFYKRRQIIITSSLHESVSELVGLFMPVCHGNDLKSDSYDSDTGALVQQ
jgi:hypothetical protein